MKFISTRYDGHKYSLSEVLTMGICPDGGLSVPESFPWHNAFDVSDDYCAFSEKFLRPFFKGDILESKLNEIIRHALNFPIPWRELDTNHYLLELFHGPTAAFKDIGARFLAGCMEQLEGAKTILVATSGDTGGAVASGFYEKNDIKVVVLFPKNAVSPLQRQQLTCWGKNILSLEVDGDFDDCQRLVKEAFLDNATATQYGLTSANSINIGRLLPQMTYYAFCSFQLFSKFKTPINFVIPSGNMGNAMAALWAKQSGLPIGQIHLACNANRAIYDFFQSKKFTKRQSIKTLANAMDVGNPSNMERLLALAKVDDSFLGHVSSSWHSDEQIRALILDYFKRKKLIVCPHTAVALAAAKGLHPQGPMVSVATAHPYKFQEIFEAILGRQNISAPDSLSSLLNRPSYSQSMGKQLPDLQKELRKFIS